MTQPGWRHDLDADAVRHARVLPLDVVQAKGSGHAGTAVSLTPALYVLFQEYLRHDPHDPLWVGRDRFVLSCGHASLALYLQLYLSGYGLELDDLRSARPHGSRTPGHPEYGHTDGVETTTGPLGQGVGNAVGLAMAARREAALLQPGTPFSTSLFGHRVWCFASDGDIEEGISHEASSLAGALGLEGLILVWDDNRITIEGSTAITFTEDVTARYRAYGFEVVEIDDAEDPQLIRAGYDAATAVTGRPVFIRLRTRLGHPMPTVGGTAQAHSGAPGVDEVAETKRLLGLDPAKVMVMPGPVLAHARLVAQRGTDAHRRWDARREAWADAHPELADLQTRLSLRIVGAEVEEEMAALRAAPKEVATRLAGSAVLAAVSQRLPWLWGGSADLAESNGVAIVGVRSFVPTGLDSDEWPGGPDGTLIHFGIREHAMGAVLNGISLGGMSRPFGATFFVFSDYMRPAVRLAALMGLSPVYIWTHDSIAAGEDGPTHQPVEHLWSYRAIPGLAVARPADWVETVDVWGRVLAAERGPTAIVLSRQSVPVVGLDVPAELGAVRGAYVLAESPGKPDAIVIATGAEVALAVEARAVLATQGIAVRVVSAPCLEWFEDEPEDYRDAVLPRDVLARVTVEAGTAQGWYRYLGMYGTAVSVESYGASGAGDLVMQEEGMTTDAIISAVHRSVDSVSRRVSRGWPHSSTS